MSRSQSSNRAAGGPAGGSARRAAAILVLWATVVGTLGWIGMGVADRLEPSTLRIAGTDSARGADLVEQHFGASEPLAILLRGPARAVDRQGPELVTALESEAGARTLSPWDSAPRVRELRPSPGEALVLADVPLPDGDTEALVERGEALVADVVSPPVSAQMTGYAVVNEGLKHASLEATERAELIALPVLLIILLIVFRSPVAAAIPLLLGGATVLASRGLTAILSEWVVIDGVAIAVASMVGLALGVDYSLLLVSRFREELRAGSPVGDAVATGIATAGRTITYAGLVLACAMVGPILLAPGALLTSLGMLVIVVVIVSVANALIAGRAVLLLLGHRIETLSFGRGRGSRLGGVLAGVLRRPLATAALVLALFLLLATPVTAFDTGPVSASQLPPGDPAREATEAVEDSVGPGWSAAFSVVLAREEGPITDQATLRELARWQREVAAQPDVGTVVGPADLLARSDEVAGGDGGLAGGRERLAGAREGLARLVRGLGRARAGVGELRRGLGRAEAGSGELADGSRQAAGAVARIDAALSEAVAGARVGAEALSALVDGAALGAEGAGGARDGAEQIARALERAEDAVARMVPGAQQLRFGLEASADLLDRTRPHLQRSREEMTAVLEALEEMTVGATDPRYEEALESAREALGELSGRDPETGQPIDPFYAGADEEVRRAVERELEAADGARRLAQGLEELRRGLLELMRGARELAEGLGELGEGAERLGEGSERLLRRADELRRGLGGLGAGAGTLRAGLQELAEGGDALGAGLAEGARRSAALEEGFERRRRSLQRATGGAPALLDSPGLFGSGYFFLAGLDAAPDDERRAAGGTVAIDRGGGAARMIVVPTAAPTTEEAARTTAALADSARELGERTGTEAALAGGAAELADYDRETSARLLWIVLAAAAIAFVLLVVILRALLLPLIAVALNLLTVAAAFGVLAVLFQLLPGEPLGGPGYTDAVSAVAIFGLIFGLSIDYEVFLLGRMREGWLASGDNATAIHHGLERTAGVITGAAAIMVGVFCVFATSEVTTIRQFGIGLAVAITLDATLVRLVLLPALMRLCGDWCWWMPGVAPPRPRPVESSVALR